MRGVGLTFQLYRFGRGASVWWRMVSPNGRGLARTTFASESVAAARMSIDLVRSRADELEPSLRLTERARWRWSLSLEGEPIVESAGDLDRRVRGDHAWRRFVALAPTAPLDPVVHDFRPPAGSPPIGGRFG